MLRIALVVVVAAGVAHADARLDESGACGSVRGRVAALVGRDPFVDTAPTSIAIATDRAPGGATGSLWIFVRDQPEGHRALQAASCEALVEDLALDVAMVLAAPPPVELEAPVAVTAPVAEPRSPWQLGVLGGAAVTADGTATADFGVRVKHAAWSLGAVLVLAGSEDIAIAPGSVHVARGEVSLLPCMHLGRAVACADLAGGWIDGTSTGFASATSATMPFAAAGLRLGWEQPLADWLSVQAYLEGRVALTTNRFFIDDMAVWTDSRLEAWLGIAAVAHIP